MPADMSVKTTAHHADTAVPGGSSFCSLHVQNIHSMCTLHICIEHSFKLLMLFEKNMSANVVHKLFLPKKAMLYQTEVTSRTCTIYTGCVHCTFVGHTFKLITLFEKNMSANVVHKLFLPKKAMLYQTEVTSRTESKCNF